MPVFADFCNETPPALLVTTSRFDAESVAWTENRHWGWIVAANSHGETVHQTQGAESLMTFFRSSAKPFQAFPLVEGDYAAELTTPELALACASHTGSAEHLRHVQSILDKAGLTPDTLQCGPHAPFDPAMLAQMRTKGKDPQKIHNNCSGKHAGMLFYCRKAGLDSASYLAPEHPLQQRILGILKQWAGLDVIPTAVDGCGAPVFYMPLTGMARLYAHLGEAPQFKPIREAMTQHPVLVGGEGRVDTVIMQVSQGALLAKVGADGVICVSRVGYGEGLALKVADGSGDIRNLLVVETLIRLGWLDAMTADDPRLVPYRDLSRRNTQGKIIGSYAVHWPSL